MLIFQSNSQTKNLKPCEAVAQGDDKIRHQIWETKVTYYVLIKKASLTHNREYVFNLQIERENKVMGLLMMLPPKSR